MGDTIFWMDQSGESGLSPSKHELIHCSLLMSVDKMWLATLASLQWQTTTWAIKLFVPQVIFVILCYHSIWERKWRCQTQGRIDSWVLKISWKLVLSWISLQLEITLCPKVFCPTLPIRISRANSWPPAESMFLLIRVRKKAWGVIKHIYQQQNKALFNEVESSAMALWSKAQLLSHADIEHLHRTPSLDGPHQPCQPAWTQARIRLSNGLSQPWAWMWKRAVSSQEPNMEEGCTQGQSPQIYRATGTGVHLEFPVYIW